MSIYKFFQAVTGLVVASASIDMQTSGIIDSVVLGLTMAADATPADGDNAVAELSFLSTPTFATHDVRGSLAQTTVSFLATTAEGIITSVPAFFATALSVRVNAGERIFLHVLASQADISAAAVAYLYVRDGLEPTARGSRLR